METTSNLADEELQDINSTHNSVLMSCPSVAHSVISDTDEIQQQQHFETETDSNSAEPGLPTSVEDSANAIHNTEVDAPASHDHECKHKRKRNIFMKILRKLFRVKKRCVARSE